MHCHSRIGKRHRPRHSDTTHGHVGLHNELAELVCNARTPTAADPLRSWGDQPAKHRWHAAPHRPTALDALAVQGRAAGCGRRRASPPASSGSSARVHAAGTSQERDRRGRWMVFSSRMRPTDNRTRCRYRVKGEANAEFLHGGEGGPPSERSAMRGMSGQAGQRAEREVRGKRQGAVARGSHGRRRGQRPTWANWSARRLTQNGSSGAGKAGPVIAVGGSKHTREGASTTHLAMRDPRALPAEGALTPATGRVCIDPCRARR